ncbi:hypothetical protein Tco_0358076, partial [Tanacetum coccineum]
MVKLGKSGLRPCQVRKAVNAMKSPNQPNVTSKQCADILAEERKQYKGKEFYSLIMHFQEKVAVDSNQYFKIDLFGGGSPRNEKEESFKWLFGKFLECTFNKFP